LKNVRTGPAKRRDHSWQMADDGHESGSDRKVIGANVASDHLNGARV
jgi:hypothetical protein